MVTIFILEHDGLLVNDCLPDHLIQFANDDNNKSKKQTSCQTCRYLNITNRR